LKNVLNGSMVVTIVIFKMEFLENVLRTNALSSEEHIAVSQLKQNTKMKLSLSQTVVFGLMDAILAKL
jgi:hypothetical protein